LNGADADDLFEPPTEADEKKSIIFKELGWFAFKIMAYELEKPANDE